MKVIHNFKIVYKDGTSYDMASDFNVLVRSFTISSPSPNIETETLDNGDGYIRMGKTWGPRKISALCMFSAVDDYDYALLVDKLFRVLMSRDEYYLISDAEPWRRWLVEISSDWSADQLGSSGEFQLSFVSASPYAESIGSSLSNFTTDVNLWGFGNGLFAEDYQYVHTSKAFRIYNAGDATVDPRRMPLKITIKSKKNISKVSIGLYNTTTQDQWTYTGSMNTTLPIVIDGTRTVRSATSLTDKTNYGLITLAPGWNSIQVSGEEIAEVSFDFRFYYL
ncbi:phage tail family protein [Bacillus sonorensis]|uniref:phage tail family protein n=1 Tax=Bacillus sonorensis TaxID=119858 RepID=UPI002DBA93B7|nr:phage tail family protein [Bacillus sonorensis]MEC1426620.1 phage tail family protein [Bacillus sonorensis]